MGQETEVEKSYSNKEVVAKLRRLADSLEQGKTFEIQIAGNRITSLLMQPSNLNMPARVTKKK